jgi:hypothetical protein
MTSNMGRLAVVASLAALAVASSPTSAIAAPIATTGDAPVAVKQMSLLRSATHPVADAAAFEAQFESSHRGWSKTSWSSNNVATSRRASGASETAISATGWSCTLYQGPVTMPNGVSGSLRAETDQICSGSFGVQQTRGKLQRSSWSGFRDYSSLVYGTQTTSHYITSYWGVDCGGPNQGKYDYRFISQGFNSASGWTTNWSVYGGSQSQRFSCGT